MITIRKLAALDLVFHGRTFILIEFGFGVVFCGALGVWLLAIGAQSGAADAAPRLLFGAYALSIGINYVPLLLYAIALARRNTARAEVAAELEQKGAVRKYSLQQLLLLVPLVIPILTVAQEIGKHARA
ncbi:MAG: hypothetical protein ACHQ4H_00450 [Ktedonobacterales bacterium]